MRIEEVRSAVAVRLRARRGEIEQAALTRTFGVSDPAETGNPLYAEGLKAAVAAAIEYGIDALEHSEDRAPPIPTTLLSQARLAARNGIALETVLRRYFAGYTLLGDFVIEEANGPQAVSGPALKRLLRNQAALFDRVIEAVTEEYGREGGGRLRSPESSQAERVRKLLTGEILDAPELAYGLGERHLGAVGTGQGVAKAFGELAKEVDRRLLLTHGEEGTVWAWLGSRRGFAPEQLAGLAERGWPAGVSVAFGEPGKGIAGWRLTHLQARAALPIALRRKESFVRYGEVALLATVIQDDLLVNSLRELYLEPLEVERDGGATARETLRAYFAAGRNSSSAAAVLGVSGRTVINRLRAAEARIGRLPDVADMEVALCLHELEIPE
jgi:hypothetical protein